MYYGQLFSIIGLRSMCHVSIYIFIINSNDVLFYSILCFFFFSLLYLFILCVNNLSVFCTYLGFYISEFTTDVIELEYLFISQSYPIHPNFVRLLFCYPMMIYIYISSTFKGFFHKSFDVIGFWFCQITQVSILH